MRIVVSGTHASGKSTLISDFAVRHPDFVVLPDPFELIDESWDQPGAAMFAAQLRLSADRLVTDDLPASVIAERSPLDFLAYLAALDELGEASVSPELLEKATAQTRVALAVVDLVVVLPLTETTRMAASGDEELELREAMNDALLDLLDDPDVLGAGPRIVEIAGDRDERLAALESLARDAST